MNERRFGSLAITAAALCLATTASGRGQDVANDDPLPPIAPMTNGGPTPSMPPPRKIGGARGRETPSLAMAALDRRVANLATEEEDTKKEIAGLGPRLADVRGRIIARGSALYRLTRLGMLPIGSGFDALVTHAMRVERARHSVQAELGRERDLRTRGVELAKTLERIAQDRVGLTVQRASMDAARVASEEDARRREAFERAFETSTGASEYIAVYGGSGTTSDPVAIGGFSGARGRLLFPVLGRAEVRPAKREGAEGAGLEIKAPLGASVRAVFGGRVAFADRYGSYGRIVILDHGERYFTVSGNLSAVDVRVGDEVSAGERIGAVGDEGQGPALYFELRHGSAAIPASPWLGVGAR